MDAASSLAAILVFPSGIFLLAASLAYEWVDRKLLAQFQNRLGPRWFQPLADVIKLLAKEEVIPQGVNRWLFVGLPVIGLAAPLTAALYIPLAGLEPAFSFPGDLIVTIYLLSLMTMCIGLAGSNALGRFSLVGATRTLRSNPYRYTSAEFVWVKGHYRRDGTWVPGHYRKKASP